MHEVHQVGTGTATTDSAYALVQKYTGQQFMSAAYLLKAVPIRLTQSPANARGVLQSRACPERHETGRGADCQKPRSSRLALDSFFDPTHRIADNKRERRQVTRCWTP